MRYFQGLRMVSRISSYRFVVVENNAIPTCSRAGFSSRFPAIHFPDGDHVHAWNSKFELGKSGNTAFGAGQARRLNQFLGEANDVILERLHGAHQMGAHGRIVT